MTSKDQHNHKSTCHIPKVQKPTNCLNLDDYVPLNAANNHQNFTKPAELFQPLPHQQTKKAVETWPSRDFVYPRFDAAFFKDDRVLWNLLKTEEGAKFQVSCNYFKYVQTEVNEEMRHTVVEWMLEVSDEERCDCEVFPLAVNYFDRFLNCEAVHKSQLQVLGTASLFLASKVKQPQPLNALRLIDYTDNSVSISDLLSWELLLLNRLQWNLVAVTPGDILDHVLFRLGLPSNIEQILRPQLQTYIAVVALEFRLAILPPSVIAVSCLCAAVGRQCVEPNVLKRLIDSLQKIIKVDMCLFEPYVDAINRHIAKSAYKLPNESFLTKSPQGSSKGSTPTDIRDVRLA